MVLHLISTNPPSVTKWRLPYTPSSVPPALAKTSTRSRTLNPGLNGSERSMNVWNPSEKDTGRFLQKNVLVLPNVLLLLLIPVLQIPPAPSLPLRNRLLVFIRLNSHQLRWPSYISITAALNAVATIKITAPKLVLSIRPQD